ncbi:hypothetical protein BC834DRAFT_867850 [Gloeopeniophorella convolvens]|nr:hypothetical protein BC834DRAFT_867850 [Gloeopeniophorella convolvens]
MYSTNIKRLSSHPSLLRTTSESLTMRPISIMRISRQSRSITSSFVPTRLFASTQGPWAPRAESKESEHSADSYFKDVDGSPADSSTHRVDSSSDNVQRPYEPPSGKYSQAGVGSEEYRTVDKNDPYDPPSNDSDKKLRYGGKQGYASEKREDTSQPGQGPEGGSAGGREPEGRQ